MLPADTIISHSDASGGDEPIPLKHGDVVAGRYVVERVLGLGGMGLVVSASDRETGTLVALKMLRVHARRDPELLARFAREARTAKKLRSPNVARVIDVGELEGGAPFIAMEHLEGEDLAVLVRGAERLPVVEAVDLVRQACLGVAEAHAHGIVHRDIKPQNLFVTRGPGGERVLKVLDFGVARLEAEASISLTRSMQMVGSPGYMSPEAFRSSRTVDARADVWSLGVVLYELLTGRRPFGGMGLVEVATSVMSQPPPPLNEVCPEVPQGLAEVVHRCLEKSREDRFSSAAALADALAPFAGRKPRRRIVRTIAFCSMAVLLGAISMFAALYFFGRRHDAAQIRPDLPASSTGRTPAAIQPP
jgi:serine/threonine protein kinase